MTILRRFSIIAMLLSLSLDANADVKTEALGQKFQPGDNVVIQQTAFDTGGNTSVRNEPNLKWKEQGYYQRNRDLGQVFTPKETFTLDALVLRTGPADKAVLVGMPGSSIFVQFYTVEGTPRLNDNGTPKGAEATHGFSTNHRCDDFIEGVTYKPFHVAQGGTFPKIPPTFGADGTPAKNQSGRLNYFRIRFSGDDRLTFQKGQRYAFMIGITEPGTDRGFTLANSNRASSPAPARLDGPNDDYAGGWSLRREGDGTVPPKMIPGMNPPAGQKQELIGQALFGMGKARFTLSPTTDGYPDVDTYRDLVFYMEGKSE